MTYHVYLAWNGTTPLYVGQTGNLDQRLETHRSRSGWWSSMTHLATMTAETRDEALDIERHYIQKLRPFYNVHLNPRWTFVANEIAWAQYLDDASPSPRARKAEALRNLRAEVERVQAEAAA